MKKQTLLIGTEHDITFRHTLKQFERKEIEYFFLDLEKYYSSQCYFISALQGKIIFDNFSINLREYKTIYQRIIFDEELFGKFTAEKFTKYILLKQALFLQAKNCLIINPICSEDVNMSKIEQLKETCLKFRFTVPESLSTANRTLAANFIKAKTNVIFKSCSSERSIVERISVVEMKKLKLLQNAPCLFQREITGCDVRVHVINNKFICEKIVSNSIDYRYSSSNLHSSIHLPKIEKEKLKNYMEKNSLYFIGADFKVTEVWTLLEINTMPGYSGYDNRCNFKISAELLKMLSR